MRKKYLGKLVFDGDALLDLLVTKGLADITDDCHIIGGVVSPGGLIELYIECDSAQAYTSQQDLSIQRWVTIADLLK